MIMLYIASDSIGHGSEELGRILMPAYLNAFSQGEELPDVIAFVNNGVNLLTTDSPALTALRDLDSKGVKLLACGTCLDYFKIRDNLAIGGVTNAVELTGMMSSAEKVIKL